MKDRTVSQTPDVLILCKDLFFSSQIHSEVKNAGLVGQTCLSQEQCLKQVERHGEIIRAVVVDLEQPEIGLAELKTTLSQHASLIAFGPHVREDLFQKAKDAGVDVLLTRGQASSSLGDVLTKLTSE